MVLYVVGAWLNLFFYIIHKVNHDSFCRRRVRLLNSCLQSRQCHAILFLQEFGNAAEKLEVHKSPGYTYSCTLGSSCPFEEIGTVVGSLPVEMKK